MLSLISWVLFAAPLQAADSAGNYAIWGNGSRSCHQFQRRAEDAAARKGFRDYLSGYLLAYNAIRDGTSKAAGTTQLTAATGVLVSSV